MSNPLIEKYGRWVDAVSGNNPKEARRLLLAAYHAKNLQLKVAPGKYMNKAAKCAAILTMDAMITPLAHPERSAMVSLFTPCEMLHVLGLTPYSAEGFSCYISGTMAEGRFIQKAEEEGIPETFCSYHKIFIGAAESGVMPKPRFILNTTLACDANMLTFKRMAEFYGVPQFVVDVPYEKDEAAVKYVTDQLRDMAKFIEKHTGRNIDENRLRTAVARGQRTMDNYERYMTMSADKLILGDLTGELYAGFGMHILLGTERMEEYSVKALEVAKNAPPSKGARILWMHTNPFWVDPLREALNFREDVQVVSSEMIFEGLTKQDPEKPYESMARRLIYSSFNGPVSDRIERGIRAAKQVKADGVVYFCHWGCKHTLGGAQLAKKKFEEAGYPTLILDGDGADHSHGGEGQMGTRIDAFIEMLEKK